MRRYTQRRDARSGQRRTLAEDIRMVAWRHFFPKNLSDTAGSNGRGWKRTYQTLREEVVLYADARGYVPPKLGQVAKAREDRDDPMDVGRFGQWKARPAFKGRGKNPIGKGKVSGKYGAKPSGQANALMI